MKEARFLLQSLAAEVHQTRQYILAMREQHDAFTELETPPEALLAGQAVRHQWVVAANEALAADLCAALMVRKS